MSVDIGDGVTSIGWCAFYGCSGLVSVDIPDGVTSIGESAFYGCSGLVSVDIPNSVTSIGGSAFYGCSGLTSVDIPDGVTSIGVMAFSGCDTIEEFIFPAGTQDYPIAIYSSGTHAGLFGSRNDGKYISTIVDKLHISDSPNALKLSYFYYDYYYNSYSEPYYLGLKELYIGRKLDLETSGRANVYVFPVALEKVEIGGCLKSDEIYNYYSINDIGPTNIKTIIYGDSIAEITDPVTTASEIYLRSTTPPETDEWENSNYLNSILYVPQGTLAAYQQADVWKNFWDIREWDSVTGIDIPVKDGDVDVTADGKQVTVETGTPGSEVKIYNADGVLVYSGKEGTVRLETPGIYVVKAGKSTKKILVK